MAKKEIKEKPIEVAFWEAANKLRGNVEPCKYKKVIFGLVFTIFYSNKLEEDTHEDIFFVFNKQLK